MEFWNFASSYDRALNDFFPYERLQTLIAEQAQCIPYIKVLDLGCGTGNTIEKLNTTYISTRGILIDGVDASQEMLRVASKKLKFPIYTRVSNKEFSKTPEEKIRLFHMDVNTFLQTALEQHTVYDRVVAVNSLYTFGNYQKTLEMIYDILDDGGICVIANPFLPKLSPVFAEHFSKNKFAATYKFLRHILDWTFVLKKNISIARSAFSTFSFTKQDDLRKMLLDAGFSITNEMTVYGDTVAIFVCRKEKRNIRRAHTQEEIKNTFLVRGKVYSTDLPSFQKEDLKDGMEYDIFDDRAIHFISKAGDRIVGCIRVIPDSEIGFLMESHFPLPEWINRMFVLEASRDALIGEFRGRGYAREIEEVAYQWSKRNGYKLWCFMINRDLIPKLVPLWKPIQLGEEMLYHNTYSTPMIRIL